MKEYELSLLKRDQLWGNKPLEVIKRHTPQAAITDFCILTGYSKELTYRINNERTGSYWTLPNKFNDVVLVGESGSYVYDFLLSRNNAIRPILILPNPIFDEITRYRDKDEIEYGYYPQSVASVDMQNTLNIAYKEGLLKKTGNTYTIDSTISSILNKPFSSIIYDEYILDNQRYIYLKANVNVGMFPLKLSNGIEYKRGEFVWVKVTPVKWLIADDAKILISKKCLVSGIRFNNQNSLSENFSETEIKKYLDNFMIKDLFQIKPIKNIKKYNFFDFNYTEISEEDLIRGLVESNIPVFLHGRPSDGKSARVKELDPDLEIIYMRNATPDSLNGKSVYNAQTGEMIDLPPTWYQNVVKKCSKEPNKIHIVFLDELTNALPSIQGMAFNIVLDREVNGKWKLPKNARIVAAGNELNDSLAANQMAEPLFNRFAHVYIHTTVDGWLKWAITAKESYKRLDYEEELVTPKIHPAIYAYIAYKSYSGENILRTPYTGDKPNADPRKWEMASKLLYKTKRPKMLKSLIGEDLASDFISFCNQSLISLEDIINKNYTDEKLKKITISQRFANIAQLLLVNDDNLEVVRNFILKFDPEFLTFFDNYKKLSNEISLKRKLQ